MVIIKSICHLSFQVKRNVSDLTNIPVRHQQWEGWPASASDSVRNKNTPTCLFGLGTTILSSAFYSCCSPAVLKCMRKCVTMFSFHNISRQRWSSNRLILHVGLYLLSGHDLKVQGPVSFFHEGEAKACYFTICSESQLRETVQCFQC